MNNIDVYKVIQEYVVYATGLAGSNVRLARPELGIETQNDRDTIVTIDLIAHTKIGMDSNLYRDIGGDNQNMIEVVSADRNVTASIIVYGFDSADIVDKISRNLKRQKAKDILYNEGQEIGYLTQGAIVNLSQVLNGSYSEIRQIDIQFFVSHFDDEEINTMNSLDIDLDYHGSFNEQTKIEVNN